MIEANTNKLTLSAGDPLNTWPVYDPNTPANNTYILTLEADDGTRSSQLDLTVVITDMLNLTVTIEVKTLHFSWDAVRDSNGNPAYYKLLENPDGQLGFLEVPGGGHIESTDFSRSIAVHLFDRLNARYRLEAYSSQGDTLIDKSEEFVITDPLIKAIGYVKASDTAAGDFFGSSVSVSADGRTLAVGAYGKNTNAGAVYLYIRKTEANAILSTWTFAVMLLAPNAGETDRFGFSVSLSGDGGILAVGAPGEDNAANGTIVSGLDSCTNAGESGCAVQSGAVYMFERPATVGWLGWDNTYLSSNIAYLKAPNASASDSFGISISLSDDGEVLVVGADGEDNGANGTVDPSADCTGLGGDGCVVSSGAVYVFERPVSIGWSGWSDNFNYINNKISYLKAPNARIGDGFGYSVTTNSDGSVLAVGAPWEDDIANGTLGSNVVCIGVNRVNCAEDSGAVYVIERPIDGWHVWDNRNISNQIIYLKAPNGRSGDLFGFSASLSGEGGWLAVGAPHEINPTNGTMDPNFDCVEFGPPCAYQSGAVYMFGRPKDGWFSWDTSSYVSRVAYLKAPNAGSYDEFGHSISLSDDGRILAVGAWWEDNAASGTIGQNFDCSDIFRVECEINSGSVYVFTQPAAASWLGWDSSHINNNVIYLKAPNAEAYDLFGSNVSLSAKGEILAVGAISEDSDIRSETGIQSPPVEPPTSLNNSFLSAGAVYLY